MNSTNDANPQVIDLNKLFGHKYELASDPAGSGHRDPVYWTLEGRYGHIYPHGPSTLGLWVIGARRISMVIKKHDKLQLYQRGDNEAVFLFKLSDFTVAAMVIRLRRKRRLSTKHRQVLKKASEATRFGRRRTVLKAA